MAQFSTSWHHLRRSPYQAIAAVVIIILTFFTISVFSFLILGSYKIINHFESSPQVQIYFKVDTKQESIDKVKKQLLATGKVASIKYVSQQDAFNIYKQQNKNDPLLLELVTADILPASLDVSTYSIKDLSGIVDAVKQLPIIQTIGYRQDVISKLTSWTDGIRKIGLLIILVLAVESILIMSTIIGIKISQRREEIEIMRLIGASNWYISLPYVYEGMFYGIFGTIIGWSLAAAGLFYYTPVIAATDFLRGIPVLPVNPVFLFELLAGEVIIAFILGIFSSLIAVSRYLD